MTTPTSKRLDLLFDLLALAGVVLITTGLALWSIPVALVTVGLLSCAVGIFGARVLVRARHPQQREEQYPRQR